MTDTLEIQDTLKVVKRNGKKAQFNGTKIAVAIKKGFDSITNEDEEGKYTTKDIQKIYQDVISTIDKEYVEAKKDKIKIEEIQTKINEINPNTKKRSAMMIMY